MTREEAITDIRDNIKPVVGGKSLDMAIKALEQELCEDAISRQAVLNCLTATGLKKFDYILNARDKIKNLPSVKPQESKLDKIDEIITDALDKSTDQKESQTLRWVLDKINEV